MLKLTQLQLNFPINKENLQRALKIEKEQAILKFNKETICNFRHSGTILLNFIDGLMFSSE